MVISMMATTGMLATIGDTATITGLVNPVTGVGADGDVPASVLVERRLHGDSAIHRRQADHHGCSPATGGRRRRHRPPASSLGEGPPAAQVELRHRAQRRTRPALVAPATPTRSRLPTAWRMGRSARRRRGCCQSRWRCAGTVIVDATVPTRCSDRRPAVEPTTTSGTTSTFSPTSPDELRRSRTAGDATTTWRSRSRCAPKRQQPRRPSRRSAPGDHEWVLRRDDRDTATITGLQIGDVGADGDVWLDVAMNGDGGELVDVVGVADDVMRSCGDGWDGVGDDDGGGDGSLL